MNKRKELLAAGYLRDFRFDCKDSFEEYLWSLDCRCVCYRVLETCPRPDGTVLVRILQQYNSVNLIQL